MIAYRMQPVPPFRLDLTAWVLRRVASNETDRWDGQTYRRVLALHPHPVEVSVTQIGPPEAPEIEVSLAGPGSATASKSDVSSAQNRLLGLDLDLAAFYSLANADARLSVLAKRFVGFKPPRLGSVFEAIVNGIACQQISLIVGITLLNRLCAAQGLSVGDHHAFPRPEDLAGASIEGLRGLGFSGRKAENMIAISRSIVAGELDPAALEQMDDDGVVKALCAIHGIGRWTAEYVALRGLGRLNVFPADDIGAQNKLQRWLGLAERPDYGEVHQAIDKWSPYRGLIYFHLLLDSQEREGLLSLPE